MADDNTALDNQDQYDTNDKEVIDSIDLATLENIFNQRNDDAYIFSVLKKKSFNKRVEGLYVSNAMWDEKKPLHWIRITDAGTYSNVSFETALKEDWENLIRDIPDSIKGQTFKSGTSDIALRYIGNNYTYETYEPINKADIPDKSKYVFLVLKNHIK